MSKCHYWFQTKLEAYDDGWNEVMRKEKKLMAAHTRGEKEYLNNNSILLCIRLHLSRENKIIIISDHNDRRSNGKNFYFFSLRHLKIN